MKDNKFGELTDVLAEIKFDIKELYTASNINGSHVIELFQGVNELIRTTVTKDKFNTERDKLRNDVGEEIRLVRDVQVEIKEILEFLEIVNRDMQYLLFKDKQL